MQRLDLACIPIRRAYGVTPYLVGSVNHRRDYRDVDVRAMKAVKVKDRRALNFMLSEYLRLTTGLPVDFQFQPPDEWAEYDDQGPRNPLGLR
jgi:hypothetical protein